jgi:hypothetical protein
MTLTKLKHMGDVDLDMSKVVVSIHITHHAGTFLCHAAKYNKIPTPDKACMTKGMTDLNFSKWKKKYGFWSLEYRAPLKKYPLSSGDWKRDDVISVVIMRNPLDRLLAGDAMAEEKYGRPSDRTAQQWWEYAHDDAFTNNYALRVFSDGDTSEIGLEKAKGFLSGMTHILDQACLNDNMKKLGKILKWDMKELFERSRSRQIILKQRQSARQRIGNDTLYEFLVKQNKHDIQLYEWSKRKSLVVCDASQVSREEILPANPAALGATNVLPLLCLVVVALALSVHKFVFKRKGEKGELKAT